jgi:2-isopropylmalate synthase
MDEVYKRFIEVADRKKQVYDEDLELLMREATSKVPQVWTLLSLQTTSGDATMPTATIKLQRDDVDYQDAACGNGPVDAAFRAIDRITGMSLVLEDYSLRSATQGKDAVGEATLHVRRGDQESVGRAADTDVVKASAMAYLNAVNRLIVRDMQADGTKPLDK